ncbi:TerB N-terminal domain-containing protein [Ruminiclostridium cellulolyticum]|uniref:TerB-C domain-containing protein n=1 Tax=Ruminiclostridium cellulolyticum (strain ATCC 35319 / DSM 5812 / JCM 6584 / H10) TaxID=394503 RepID=B8I964_RUMCH|nr:TerB N-terminal domain-containing protein [Ruminiclostridium cellulolyticum]ACL75324.1 conserved hypothetical protein [Ruminiclostridium cellulolyticum H10]
MVNELSPKSVKSCDDDLYQLHLCKSRDKVILRALKGSTPVKLSLLASEIILPDKLRGLLKKDKEYTVVNLQWLENLKKYLCALTENSPEGMVKVVISKEIEALKRQNVPQSFNVMYSWSEYNKGIGRQLPAEVIYCGKGCFKFKNYYWIINGVDEEDDRWLRKEYIHGSEIIDFITNILPKWEKQSLPYISKIKYVDESILDVVVKQVCEESIELLINWRVNSEELSCIPSLPGYFFADGIIMPGILPKELGIEILKKSGNYILKGDSTAVFMKEIWPKISQYTKGDVDALLRMHKVVSEHCELVLSIRRLEKNGIGRIIGIPKFVFNNLIVKAKDILPKLNNKNRFIKIDSNWIPVENIKKVWKLGNNDGEFIEIEFSEVAEKRISPLKGTWNRVEYPNINLPYGEETRSVIARHIEFLREWGIPGGVVCNLELCSKVFLEAFIHFIRKNPTARILVIGKKNELDLVYEKGPYVVNAMYEGTKRDPQLRNDMTGLIMATPRAIEEYEGLAEVEWDIMCILDANNIVKTHHSKLYRILTKYSVGMVIGHFSSSDFLSRQVLYNTISDIFKVKNGKTAWKYGLYDSEKIETKNQKVPVVLENSLQEVSVNGIPASKNLPVTPKPEKREFIRDIQELNICVTSKHTGYIQSDYYEKAYRFLERARSFEHYKADSAKYVPFSCEWPTYDSMSIHQREWYFWWREQVRMGLYLETDLSYVLVYIYELVNLVGVSDPIDGYEKLYTIWEIYRNKYLKLDFHLLEWIMDYIIINDCPIDFIEILKDNISRCPYFHLPDFLIPYYTDEELSKMSTTLIARFIDYPLKKSKFYTGIHQELLDKYIPRAIAEVNFYLKDRFGKGIFELYKPTKFQKIIRVPFQGAVYGRRGEKELTATVIPYSQHGPLREFLTSVVKHTENKIRELKKFSGKLQGYTLERDIQRIIDKLIQKTAVSEIMTKAKPKINIDTSKVKQLIKDSDQVCEKLISGLEEYETVSNKPEEVSDIEEYTIDGVISEDTLTDSGDIYNILMLLTQDEKNLIKILLQNGFEAEDELIVNQMQGIFIETLIDHINEISLDIIGDMLVSSKDSSKVIEEDYREELLSLEDYLNVINEENEADGLPDEWKEFKTRLTDYQIQTLKAIVEIEEPMKEINKICEENLIMPAMLIDSVNEVAVETIGDIIIDPDRLPPLIIEGTVEILSRLVKIYL